MAGGHGVGRRVLLVGWECADWALLNPLLDAGQLPHLAALIGRGAMGPLNSLAPGLPAALWTSVATGLRADTHGVLDEQETDALTGERRPVASTARQRRALWNLLTLRGLRSAVVNWPASHPAEPVAGAVVSERFPRASAPLDADWPLREGTVHPARLAETLAELRIHPGEVGPEDVLPFLPELGQIDLAHDQRPLVLTEVLAETASVHAAATHLAEHEPWDLLAVRYHGLGRLAPHFLALRPPRLAAVSEAEVQRYGAVLDGYARLLDLMLGRLVQLAGPETTVLLVSERGLRLGDERAALAPIAGPELGRPAPASAWTRGRGIVCLAGPDTREDALIHGAGLLDIAPTVLSLLGLPAGEDMPGRLLREAFETPPTETRIASWEALEGADGRHPPPDPQAMAEARTAIEQLAALGYAEFSLAEQRAQEQDQRRRELMAVQTLIAAGQWREAADRLAPLQAAQPGERLLTLMLAVCRLALGEHAACRALAESTGEPAERRPVAKLLLAMLETAEGRPDTALALLQDVRASDAPPALLLFHLGLSYRALGRLADAEQVLREALARDPELAAPQLALAFTLLQANRPREAAEAALDAIGMHYRWPEAHCALGIALAQQGQVSRARLALQTSVAQRPTPLAHAWLGLIAERALNDPERAERHRQEAEALARAKPKAADAGGSAPASDAGPGGTSTAQPTLGAASPAAAQLPVGQATTPA